MTLILTLGVASVYADEHSVKMRFSGTAGNSANNLQQPNTSNDEDNFAGNGTLGSFTVRNVRAISNNPAPPPGSCSGANQLYLPEPAGGGVFRFDDGSLLYLSLTQGADCIDLTNPTFECTLIFKITGGTGRFRNASGVLTMTEAGLTVLSDANGNPVLFAATGEYTGTISGICEEEGHDSAQ